MPAKTKTKKSTKSKTSIAKKATSGKKTASGNKTAMKKTMAAKATSKKKAIAKPNRKKVAVKAKPAAAKRMASKPAKKQARAKAAASTAPKKKVVRKSRSVDIVPLPRERSRQRTLGRLSGDLQGLSGVSGADSESVGELVEEGNAFEAAIVSGVEAADADEGEVRTHEVPEDDVPQEYLDED
jgi:hypothetical protein